MKDYLGRRSSWMSGIFIFLFELISCVYVGLFKSAIGQIIITSILAGYQFYSLVKSKPFQNSSIRQTSYFYSIYHLLFMLILLITVLSGNNLAVSLNLILIIPISYKLSQLLNQFQTSFKNIMPLIYEGNVQNYDFELRNFLQNVKFEYEDYRLSSLSLIVDQLALIHKSKCLLKDECFCSSTDNTKRDYQESVISGKLRNCYVHDFLLNVYQAALKQIEIRKQTLDTQLCFSYLNYLIYSQKSKVLAFSELVRYRNHPSLSFREQSLMSELFQSANQSLQNQENDRSMMSAIRFDEEIEIVERIFQSTLKMKEGLLILLFNDHIDLKELRTKAIELKLARDNLQKQLVELSKIHYSNQPLQFLLDGYVTLLGFGQVKKGLFKQKKTSLYQKKNQRSLNIDSAFFDKDCCIVFLTLVNKIGTIQKCQNKFSTIFGYSMKDVQGKNIGMIIPQPAQKHHDHLMQKYVKGQMYNSKKIEDSDDISLQDYEMIEQQKQSSNYDSKGLKDIVSDKLNNTSRFYPILLGLNAKGWAIPISLTLKFDVISQDDCGVTGLIQKLNSDYYYMQVDQDNFQIQAVSEQLYMKIFDSCFVQNDLQKIYFNRFAPFLKYFSQMSQKKLQKPKISDLFQKVGGVTSGSNANNNKEIQLKQIQNNDNQDIFKTIFFIPKQNYAERNQIYSYDKPLLNDQQLKNQINNYSLEYYDIFVSKFKFYHKDHQYFKYSIIEFHSFRKITEPYELKDTLIKLQKKFSDILSIDYEITENLNYVDQLNQLQMLSQANINSFIDIIEQELKNKNDQDMLHSFDQQQLLIQSCEENIEATDRFQQSHDNRSNLFHLDPNSKMVSHLQQHDVQQHDGQQQQQQNLLIPLNKPINSSLMVIDDLNQTIQNDQSIQYLKPQNNHLKPIQYKQQLSKQNKTNSTKTSNSTLNPEVQDRSYQILSHNDQSFLQYDQDNSIMHINQLNNTIRNNPLGIDDLTTNQNNFSITYSRQNYNEIATLFLKDHNQQNIQNQQTYLIDLQQKQNQNKQNQNDNSLSLIQQNIRNVKQYNQKELPYDEINNYGIYPSQSLLSPNYINTSKLSLNTTTSRNLMTSKSKIQNIVLSRLEEEISKETDTNRLMKMETLKKNIQINNLDDLPFWKSSSLKQLQLSDQKPNKNQSAATLNNFQGLDKRSKIETSYIIKQDAESSKDCTDTIDREERIKRELQERSRMVAASSRQSSHSNNTDMKKNLKKSLNSRKRNLLMIILTIFGVLALTSIMTLTIFQYFSTKESFRVIKTDFNFIPWAIDLRSDYTIPLLYQGLLKLSTTKQFPSLLDPNLKISIDQRMQKSYNHLKVLYNFYQTADINDREYFDYINDNPIHLIIGKDDLIVDNQTEYVESDKIIQKVNLDYFIQTLAAYQFNVVYGQGYTNYYEKIQVDNFKTFEEQSILVSEVAMAAATDSNDGAVTQTLVLLILVITVSFILISAIFPLYYYVQTNNQSSLKLFATISSDHLAGMLKPIQFTLAMSKTTKITANFNVNFQSKYKKRKNISSTNFLPKFKLSLLICGLIGFVTLIIQPIVNYVLLTDFKSEVSRNIKLLDSLYSVRSLLVTNMAVNYQYLAQAIDENIFLYNKEFFYAQVKLMNVKYVEKLNEMYQTIKEDQSKKRHSQELYDDFLQKILSEDLCDAIRRYPEYVYEGNEIDNNLCNTVRKGLLKKGFQISVKDYFSHIELLEQIYELKPREELVKGVQGWTESSKVMELDEYFQLLAKTIAIIKDFMIKVMDDYLDYMKFIQTVLLIFQIFALIFLFIFGWVNFYYTIQNEMILIKQLFSVLSIETVLENPYIVSYLNK